MALARFLRDDTFTPSFENFFQDFPRTTRGQAEALTAGTEKQGQMIVTNMRLDVSETPNEYKITADLPGYKKEDIQVSFEDQMLRISAERKEEKEQESEMFHVVERRYGQTSRSIRLPTTADGEKVSAKYQNGVLKICIQKKKEEAKRARIAIN